MKFRPFKRRPRVSFSTRRYVTMTNNMICRNLPGIKHQSTHRRQLQVLIGVVARFIGTFQLNTHLKVITARSALEAGDTRMPGALMERHVL